MKINPSDLIDLGNDMGASVTVARLLDVREVTLWRTEANDGRYFVAIIYNNNGFGGKGTNISRALNSAAAANALRLSLHAKIEEISGVLVSEGEAEVAGEVAMPGEAKPSPPGASNGHDPLLVIAACGGARDAAVASADLVVRPEQDGFFVLKNRDGGVDFLLSDSSMLQKLRLVADAVL